MARRLDRRGGASAVLTRIVTVAETGSTNADLLALARAGAEEGLWLRADCQTAGRGRQGRAWLSPPGNFYGSTLVSLRPSDPPAASLALVAGVAVWAAVGALIPGTGWGTAAEGAVEGGSMRGASPVAHPLHQPAAGPPPSAGKELLLRWPNDVLLGGAKLAGILLERAADAVVVGIGVNVAHHPDLADRPTTSLVAHGLPTTPAILLDRLAATFAAALSDWRTAGIGAIVGRWLAVAHPPGTRLRVVLPGGETLAGIFETLASDGALILHLASGESRVIHAADVFLV